MLFSDIGDIFQLANSKFMETKMAMCAYPQSRVMSVINLMFNTIPILFDKNAKLKTPIEFQIFSFFFQKSLHHSTEYMHSEWQ